jgi:putative tricarboxylic transport membrane protein
LGGLFEDNLRRALAISGGNWAELVSSPSSVCLYILAAMILLLPLWISRRKNAATGDSALVGEE